MKNAVSGIGLAPDAAMVTFPVHMFLPGSDLASLKERKREFYDGLTRWNFFESALRVADFHPVSRIPAGSNLPPLRPY